MLYLYLGSFGSNSFSILSEGITLINKGFSFEEARKVVEDTLKNRREQIDEEYKKLNERKGTVVKIGPGGDLIKEIPLEGKKPSNIAFGGKDGRRAFVTVQDQGSIETFLVDTPGREWKSKK